MSSGPQVETVEAGREHERGIVQSRARFDRWIDRRPELAELGRRWFRFVLVGGIVFCVYVGTTTFLAEVIGIHFEVALAIGFALALATHFNLQRLYVWRTSASFALPVNHQLARYLPMAGLQYGLTAGITATLPHALGVSPEVVYLPTALVLAVTNFLIFRSRIFHAAVDPLHPERASRPA
jgi:putative flippase GtrA